MCAGADPIVWFIFNDLVREELRVFHADKCEGRILEGGWSTENDLGREFRAIY